MVDERNDSHDLPACVTAYIAAMLKKMGYRRKAREDVRAEITVHFEDELRDCTTEKEKEQKAGQLITEFGDLKLLGILLRRAKIRCRPLWRTLVARTCQGIGILLLCLIFYAIWFSFGEPTIRMDYILQLDQMNQPQFRNEDNAWPHYEKAISLYVRQSPLVEQFISRRHHSKKREEALRLKNLINEQQVQTWLKKNQNHWDNFSPEQEEVVIKCFEYNWVPFPKTSHHTCNEWQATTFQRMTEHSLTCIRDEAELTTPLQCGALPDLKEPGFPYSELKSWQTNSQIPTNFLEAVSVAVLREGMKRYKELPESTWSPLTDTECEYISPWIKQNEAAWREFAAGALKPYCYKAYQYDPNPRDHWSFGFGVPQMLRKLAWLGIWRSRINMKQGQIQQGFEDCLTVARAGSHWQGKGRIGQQFSGQSMSKLAWQEVLHIAAAQDLPATDLKQLQQQLSRIYPEGYPHMNMEAERLAFLDTVQRVFTDEGFGGGHLIPGRYMNIFQPRAYDDIEARMLQLPGAAVTGMVHARRNETIRKGNEIYYQRNEMLKMTPYEKYAREIDDDEIYLSLPWEKYFLIHRLMRATYGLSEFTHRSKAFYQATIVTLALKRWRLEKNVYPETLSELIAAGFIEALPMDPYSEKPLIYRRADDDFILYSVGPDFTDDAGQYGVDRYGQARKWADNGDTVFWPLPAHQVRTQQ
ncbi:MAG: hypothetical protein JSW47_01975 [Phycisphaerales bacterium]|nr:MAG: hypothetical protein JSW47_01975 [Phycisphaerales bacterium]